MSVRSSPQYEKGPPKRHSFPGSTPSPKGLNPEILQKVVESARELQSFLQEWNKLHSAGCVVLDNIKRLKLGALNGSEKKYPEGLQERCDNLQEIVDVMEACLANLATLVQQFNALTQLNALQGTGQQAIFLSWSIQKFRQAFQEIYHAYVNELSLKITIKEEVAHNTNKDALIYHVTSWTEQPFIGQSCKLLCDSLFCETDIR